MTDDIDKGNEWEEMGESKGDRSNEKPEQTIVTTIKQSASAIHSRCAYL